MSVQRDDPERARESDGQAVELSGWWELAQQVLTEEFYREEEKLSRIYAKCAEPNPACPCWWFGGAFVDWHCSSGPPLSTCW